MDPVDIVVNVNNSTSKVGSALISLPIQGIPMSSYKFLEFVKTVLKTISLILDRTVCTLIVFMQ